MPLQLKRASSRPAPARGCGRAARTRMAIGLSLILGWLSSCKGGDDRPATWEYLSPVIFEPTCATGSCHGPASAVSGLDFSTPERGYTSLTGLWVWIVDPQGTEEEGCMTMRGTVVCQRYQRPLVVPFNPSQSRLINVLRAQNAPRMPPNRPLAEADIALVERWILNGALPAGGGHGDGGPGDGGADAAQDAASATDSMDAAQDLGADATLDGAAAVDSAHADGSGDGAGVN